MTTLAIAIRARVYRDGIAAALASRPDVAIVSAEPDAAGASAALTASPPDALLVDVGLDGALALMALAHGQTPPVKVVALALCADGTDAELLRWAEAGADGFVTCEHSMAELLECIDAALRGELACSPRVSARLLRRLAELAAGNAATSPLVQLTPRLTVILQLLRAGKSNKQIARELGIELATVKNHVHHLLRRLQVHHRHEAAAITAQRPPGQA